MTKEYGEKKSVRGNEKKFALKTISKFYPKIEPLYQGILDEMRISWKRGWAHIGISFLHSGSGVLTYFQVQRAGEGFQVAGCPDPEAKRLNVLFALPLK